MVFVQPEKDSLVKGTIIETGTDSCRLAHTLQQDSGL